MVRAAATGEEQRPRGDRAAVERHVGHGEVGGRGGNARRELRECAPHGHRGAHGSAAVRTLPSAGLAGSSSGEFTG